MIEKRQNHEYWTWHNHIQPVHTCAQALKEIYLIQQAELSVTIMQPPDMYWDIWRNTPGLVSGLPRNSIVYRRCFAADEMIIRIFGGNDKTPLTYGRAIEYYRFLNAVKQTLDPLSAKSRLIPERDRITIYHEASKTNEV